MITELHGPAISDIQNEVHPPSHFQNEVHPSPDIQNEVHPSLDMQILQSPTAEMLLAGDDSALYVDLPGKGRCSVFTLMRHSKTDQIRHVGELLYRGVRSSELWRNEMTSGGLDVTKAVTIFQPREGDAIFLARIGNLDGFKLLDVLGLGEID